MSKRLFCVFAISAAVANAAGPPMPWNSGLSAIAGNLTGPTALGLTLGGAAITFAPMIFHGQIPEWGSRAGYVALVGGTLLGIPTLVNYFGLGGALV
jgi:type IV secretory pathway VirB2 component (pilin)